MKNKIIYLLVLCFIGAIVVHKPLISQSSNKVEIVMIPPNDGTGKSILLPIKILVGTYDLVNEQIQLSKEDGSAFTQEEISRVSMISGTGSDFGYPDMNAGTMLFRLAILDGDFFLKKMVAMEMDMLVKAMQLTAIQTASPVYKDVSSMGTIEGRNYIINFQIALVKVTIGYPGKYLVLKNFSVVPADSNPFENTWYSNYYGKASFYITFESLSTAELVKYPSLNIKWNKLVSGATMVYQLPSEMDDDMCSGNFNPSITMLAIRKDFLWGTSDTITRFDFTPGIIDAIPRSPALSVTENEFSLTLNWTPENFASGYSIYRSESSISDVSLLTPFNQVSAVTTFEDLTTIPGQRYFYQVLPIRSDGMEGIVSNEANGMANSPVLLTVNDFNQNYQKGVFFDISGNVSSAKTAAPLDQASVNAFVEELSFAYNNTTTNSAGDFTLLAEAPAVSGTYQYVVQTQYNTEGEGLKYSVSVFEDPSKGHDLEIANASVGALFKQPGQNITVSYTLKNHGLNSETGLVDIVLFDDEDNLIGSIAQDAFTLASGGTLSKNTAFTLPSSLADGNYYIQINSANEQDEHRTNNAQKTTFFVSSITNPPAYRLGAHQFDSVAHTKSIDGYAVTLIGATSSTATFSIDGEGTGPLEIGEYWFNNAATFMLHVNAINYFNSSFLDIDIRAGATNTGYSYNPYFNVGRKGESTTTLFSAPSGSQLNDQIDFIIDIDSIILQSWLQPVIHPNNQLNKLDANFIVPGNTESRTYYSYAKTTDANYWWIKRLYLTPIKRRNLSTHGNLIVSNLTAPPPGNITGDRFEISGSFKNNGDFDEMTIVKFCLLNDNDSIWFDHDTLNIPSGGQHNFSFTLPTLGMEAQNYTIEVVAAQSEDIDLSDNKFTANLLLEEVLEASCYFDDFAAFYEAGDTIHAAVHVEHLETTITTANVLLEITSPGGQKRLMPAYFDAPSQSYRADYVTDLSGNYYFTATTSAKRYLNASAESVAKVKVYLNFENTGNILYLGNTAEFKLTASNVGGVYAFAGHFDFDEHLTPLQAYQGNLISPSTSILSTLSFSASEHSFELGITRLNTASPNYSAYAEHTLCLVSALCSNSGSYAIQIPAYTLYDHHGEAMVCDLHIVESDITEPELFFRLIPNDTLYSFGDTLTLTASILGKSNLQGISFDLNYNDTLLQYLGTEFHNSLGEYGDFNLLREVEDDGAGIITLGSIRSNSGKIGCDYSIIKIAETKFIVKGAGELSFIPEHVHLFSPYEGVEYPFTLDTYSAHSVPYDPNSLIFSPDTLSLWPSQSDWSQLYLSGLKNVFAVSLELDFDTSCVHIDTITEGNLLNFDNQSTAFEYLVDSLSGKVYVGITRMNNLMGGVTTDTSRSVINLKVNKKVNTSSVIETSQVKIIDPLGNQYTNSFGPNLVLDSLHLHEQQIPLFAGWNIISFSVQPQQQEMIPILQELISNQSLVKVINESGGFIQEIPGIGWMNTIGIMENTEGYYTKVSSHDTLHVAGIPVSLPLSIALNTGWNIMGYPSQQAQDAIAVLQPLINEGVLTKVINESGGFIQQIPGIGWLNTMGNMEEGEGYYIKVSENTSLSILDTPGQKSTINSQSIPHPINPIHYQPTGITHGYQPMHFVFKLESQEEYPMGNGDEIAIYDGELCVGAGTIDGPGPYVVVAHADDPITPETDGYIPGNNLTIKYWDCHNSCEKFDVNIQQTSGSNVFSPFETWVGNLNNLPGTMLWDDLVVSQNRPNPFVTSTYVDYVLLEESFVTLQIFDIHGNLVREVIREKQNSGYYSKEIERGGLRSGIYFCGFTVKNEKGVFERNIKLIIQ